ncbi:MULTISPECIES: IS66 family insertion sequence element accessory protein TnpB [unclassified Pseudomonas]|uniref:IS66 family insertion sequence element accessory protein TnpB n=1 Tax=unclassified Pseudomonas TaxID=196821 RepID=UPI00215BB8B3|nr:MULTISPECIES: IS66 family insertion sequence element accessory protein TnpB [unclassified Pseudomonas]MCR8932222.1 IS66 family insertion sequence element accessory protein TnpB [Pseudomonas sp. S11A4]MCR8975832.1 IS66 family insertion sequence element accessory protein TnpB [Pseudomonas sp. S11P7]
MIRIDSIWLATEPVDMRAGTETAQPHCAYLFANRRANRMKVLVHDGFGIWLAARRLNQGKFHWPGIRHGSEMERMPSNFKPWYWVCHGNAQVLEARSHCFNGCH